MPSYPPGEPSQYYVNDPQAGAYNDPRQFDPYIPHQPAHSNAYDTGEYREPYQDEPTSDPFPQGQSMEPLGPNTKEEVSFYADESNPIPRETRYVALCFVRLGFLMGTLEQEREKSASMEVPTRSSSLDTGKQAAVSLSVLLLHSSYYLIPRRRHCPLSRVVDTTTRYRNWR